MVSRAKPSVPSDHTFDKSHVARIGHMSQRILRRHPDRGVVGLAWRSQSADRMRDIDMTQLFGVPLVFRHPCEPPKRAKATRPRDGPPGFLEHLAVQRPQWIFPRIDPAAGQLQLEMRLSLPGQQQFARMG